MNFVDYYLSPVSCKPEAKIPVKLHLLGAPPNKFAKRNARSNQQRHHRYQLLSHPFPINTDQFNFYIRGFCSFCGPCDRVYLQHRLPGPHLQHVSARTDFCRSIHRICLSRNYCNRFQATRYSCLRCSSGLFTPPIIAPGENLIVDSPSIDMKSLDLMDLLRLPPLSLF
jgi:hypothetical protein